jgi:serine beta-lactamase-like protein LACTB, mitochondrial
MKMKTQTLFKNLVILLSIFGSLFSCKQKPKDESIVQNTKYKQSIVEVYKNLGLFCHLNSVPGLTLAVSIDNQIVFADGLGYSNVELKTTASPSHLFRIGQVSQIITSLTAAKLYEEGKLNLDKPVNELFPDLNVKSATYSLYQLGVQSAGINEPKPIAGNGTTNRLEEYVATYINDPLIYEPGTNVFVTDAGFDLLGYFIQKSANEYFPEVVKKNLLNNLQLTGTKPDNPYVIFDNKASQYDLSVGIPGVARQVDLRGKEASSGYLSSVLDLVKMGNTLIYPGYFKKETIDMITKRYAVKNGQNSISGFGMVVNQDKKGQVFYGQKGNVLGGSAAILIIPEDKLVIAMAANMGSESWELPIFEVASIFQAQLHPERAKAE